ncbi:MAG: VWA domain-containing protein, partial [Lentimicrobiaceae bacterium]|nr:VWA domain-containing protein [Lentimicrobiaceae bacterium]
LAAVLSFSAITNNDKVGVIFFNDKVQKFIPPKKGKTHILRIISELVNISPQQSQTNTALALQYLTNVIKKKCTAFVISDFLDTDFETALRITGKKHDISALQVCDRGESLLPSLGLMQIQDIETGQMRVVNTSAPKFQSDYKKWWQRHDHELKEVFRRTGTDNVRLFTDRDYVPALTELFKKRR